jgi:molybdate transport system substrate-binding protein
LERRKEHDRLKHYLPDYELIHYFQTEGKMNKISISTILLTLINILILTTVTGCTNPESLSPSPTPGPESSPAPTPQISTNGSVGELLIFAAAGTKPAIDAASRIFEQKNGVKVTVNYGGGGEVLSSMVISKQGDIYISPEQRFMDNAKKQGAIAKETAAVSLAYMIPVIGVKKGNPENIHSLSDLAKPGIEVVMGNPETTALGVITPEILKKAALYDAVKGNIVTSVPQVTAIITMLKMSQIDAGFIWHYFGTTSTSEVDIIWIPSDYVTGIGEIQAAVSTFTHNNASAGKFINFLTSPEGKEIFKNNGYIVDRQEAEKHWLGDR